MSTLTIRTNGRYRPTLGWAQLTKGERDRFDWLDTDERQAWASFIRYKGMTYCVDEFISLESKGGAESEWHGYRGDSFFSGVLIKIDRDGDVCLGTYYS